MADVFKKHRNNEGKTTMINQNKRDLSVSRKYGVKKGDKILPEMTGQ